MKFSYLAHWAVAVVATGAAFVLYLALRFENMRLGYELDAATQEHKRLTEVKQLLSLEAQTLRERQRVHAIAERSLGMSAPDLGRVVVVRESAGARGAGRAQ
jgi:cell division protein FtsL